MAESVTQVGEPRGPKVVSGLSGDGTGKDLVVNDQSKGIKNVFVSLVQDSGTPMAKIPSKPVNHTVTLTREYELSPRFTLARTGDALQFAQQVGIGFSPTVMFVRNKQSMVLRWPATLKETEPTPIPIRCDLNPALTAFLVVLDHPYAAVSDQDGIILIEDIPVGSSLTFRAWHEAGKISDVKMGGEPTTWARGRFQVNLKPGLNDLGEVIVPVR